MKKKIMIIGPCQSGKSTLANYLEYTDQSVKHAQDVIYGKNTIDTPGSYLENTRMYKYIISTAQSASHILVLVNQSYSEEIYSPGFVKIFKCPVIGVITKSDMHQENYFKCVQQLQHSGVIEPIFSISLKTKKGLDVLEKYLECSTGKIQP
jgi:ethanolamine utilization protein EutP